MLVKSPSQTYLTANLNATFNYFLNPILKNAKENDYFFIVITSTGHTLQISIINKSNVHDYLHFSILLMINNYSRKKRYYKMGFLLTAVKDASRNSVAIEKVKKIVNHFKHSEPSRKRLKERQTLARPDDQPLNLITAVPTRWNSTYLMLQRFIKVSIEIITKLTLKSFQVFQNKRAS